jgi:hypothetical protein
VVSIVVVKVEDSIVAGKAGSIAVVAAVTTVAVVAAIMVADLPIVAVLGKVVKWPMMVTSRSN